MLAQNGGVVALEKREILRVGDHSVLYRLGKPGRELYRRQGRQKRQVGGYEAGLMKGAKQVLSGGHVHARFPTDRRIDHRQQGRGKLDVGYTPEVGRGDKPGEVSYHATAEGDHGAVPTEMSREHAVGE